LTKSARFFQPIKPLFSGFFCILFLAWFSTAGLTQPSGYYNTAAGKTGATLKTALYNIIKGHTAKSYDYLWTAFQTTDKKSDGKVWDMYSDIPNGTPPYEFTFVADQCGNYGGEGDCYNREHSWPKSWFGGTVSPMYTDLFHLCPTDGYVNGNRSNYPFGTVSSPTWTSLNGSKVGPCSWQGYTGTVFEPRDDFKGDFARNYLYMATRYENLIAGWPSNDPNAAAILSGNAYPAFKTWYVNMLLAWSAADPVSAKEIARNNAVYAIQNNRNPYIDHPEYAVAVWAPETVKGEPTNYPAAFSVTTGSPSWSALTLTWTDATGVVIPDGYLIRGSTTGFAAIITPVDGIPVSDGNLDKNIAAGTQWFTFSGLTTNTNYYFKIFPYTNTGILINFKITGSVPQASIATTPVSYDVTGTGTYCMGEPGLTVTLGGSQTGVSYQLKKDGGNVGDAVPGTGIAIHWLNCPAGTYTVEAVGPYGLVTMNNSAVITEIMFPDAAGTISGPDTVIRGQSGVSYNVSVIGNTIYYIWELPVGATINSGDSTNSIQVSFSSSSQSGIIRVKGINQCGNGVPSPDFNIIVTDSIPAQLTITDTLAVGEVKCFNATQTIIAAGNGTGFIVEDGGDAILIAGENILFLDGSVVQQGGHLSARITTTADYCGDKSPSMVNTFTKEAELIPEAANKLTIRVYPNPTEDNFTLELDPIDKDVPVIVTIYNMTGKIITEDLLRGITHRQYTLTGLPSGIYFIHLLSNDRSMTIRIIRN
jgi:endonuclease I